MKPWPTKGIRRSFWLPRELLSAIKETAGRRRISQNEAVRQAIASYLGECCCRCESPMSSPGVAGLCAGCHELEMEGG